MTTATADDCCLMCAVRVIARNARTHRHGARAYIIRRHGPSSQQSVVAGARCGDGHRCVVVVAAAAAAVPRAKP